MTSLAFHGGTCLRFLFSLPRYSEDLGFTLENRRSGYDLRVRLKSVRAELSREGYQVDLRLREHRAVHSAYVRFPGVLYELSLSPHRTEVLSVKIEVDTRPPAGVTTTVSLVRRHETLRLFHHDRASLLAGKLHALLQRPYTKGRDLYDLIWYLSDPEWPEPNLSLLNAALQQTDWRSELMAPATWRHSVAGRLEALDWERAAADVRPFLERRVDVDLVSKENALRLLT